MSFTLLLISELPEDKVFAAEVAVTAGLSLKIVGSAAEGASVIAQEDGVVLLADVSTEKQYLALESALQSQVGLFSDKVNPNRIHFMTSAELEKVQYLVQSPFFGQFLLRNFTNVKEVGAHYGRIIKQSIQERAFGLQGYLSPQAKVQTIRLKKSSQKQDAVEAVKNFLIAGKFQSRMASAIANAVDELIMNAIYDAPVDDIGKQLFVATSRTTQIELEGKHCVDIQVGFDGQYVGIAAIDLFGSLDKAKLITHISKIYSDEEYRVRTSIAGAGIGLATVFKTGGSLLFVSESRVKTEALVFYKRCDSYREFKDQFRFVSTQFYF